MRMTLSEMWSGLERIWSWASQSRERERENTIRRCRRIYRDGEKSWEFDEYRPIGNWSGTSHFSNPRQVEKDILLLWIMTSFGSTWWPFGFPTYWSVTLSDYYCDITEHYSPSTYEISKPLVISCITTLVQPHAKNRAVNLKCARASDRRPI